MVAFDAETNEQLGWTLMCGPDAIVKDMFAFMPISGDVAFGEVGLDEEVGGQRREEKREDMRRENKKIGLIAAVGVDVKARGRGVGLAMVVRAMEVSFSFAFFSVTSRYDGEGNISLGLEIRKVTFKLILADTWVNRI